MGLFSKSKKGSEKNGDFDKKVSNKISGTKRSGEVKPKKTSALIGNADMAYKYIVRPWITEKTQEMSSDNKYVFKVRIKTSKKQIKVAVEKLYNVKVEKVNIINIPQKKRRFGRIVGKKSAIRKAIVTLSNDHKIDFFE